MFLNIFFLTNFLESRHVVKSSMERTSDFTNSPMRSDLTSLEPT